MVSRNEALCSGSTLKLMSLYIEPDTAQKEILSSWALFILIMLLIIALFASYMLQHKKIQAVHETVLSIFAGRALKKSETKFVLTALRDGCWASHQVNRGDIHSNHRQLQPGILLQSITSANYPSVWL